MLLIMLTLLAGTALGWALRDQFGRGAQSPATAIAIVPTATALPQPTPDWTATPIFIPTNSPTIPSALVATDAPTPTDLATQTPLPTSLPTPTALPPSATPAAIIGYAAHTVADGESLATIAEQGGSDPALIEQYNRLGGPPQVGRALIVPQLDGRTSQLQNPPTLIQQGPKTRPWVALTLDAGAGAEPTGKILDALRTRAIHITFFVTGKWIRENPDLVRQIVADGHEIANHTMNHPDLRKIDDSAIQRELAETDQALRDLAQASTRPFFRPPYGAYDQHVLQVVQAEGYLPIYWTLDSLDSVGEPKTAAFLLERITTKLPPEKLRGAIILAHCGNATTAEAMPAILDRFAEMGFEVHTLTEVLNG
jgi:peptidoglycan/xylan/chitin deacetylase (PgdA/CDA1 family)